MKIYVVDGFFPVLILLACLAYGNVNALAWEQAILN